MDQEESAVTKNYNNVNQELNYQLNHAPSVTLATPTCYDSENGQQVPKSVPVLLASDPPSGQRNSNQSLEVGIVNVAETSSDTSEKNIVAAWVDEFLQLSHQQDAVDANFPADDFQQTSLKESKSAPSYSPPSYDTSQQINSDQKASQEDLLPTTVTSPPEEHEKKHKCHLCNTSYATPTRLKRHFGTKKHKTASEKQSTLSCETSPKNASHSEPPKTTISQTQMMHPEKLSNFCAPLGHQCQQQQQQQRPIGKLPHMPQFRAYSEHPHNVDSYSPNWPLFHSQLDFLRSSQTLMSPTTESQHTQGNPLFFHQPHLNPDVYYNKISFSSLCNSHQPSLNQIQSPQYIPDSVPSPDQPRSFVPTQSYHQTQSPASPWYYPATPYPSPSQYLQRNSYSNFPIAPTSEPYQKFETNNNYFPVTGDSGSNSAFFNQRSFQQEALNLWTPKIVNPDLDISVEEVDEISDDSETMSPVLSPDSQYEPVSSTECPDVAALPEEELPGNEADNINLRCELCDRDFTKLSYLTQHNNAAHPMEIEHPYRCNICEKSYSKLSLLVKHSNRHTGGEKPFKCDVCDTEFGYKVDLTRHKYLHSGNKSFNCHLCPKSCARKDQLMRHLRGHESHAHNVSK